MKEKLVVVGNGMAGARFVEELLRRDAERYEIAMFGDEPHGNYNRILLSSVLNGSHDEADIFLNPLDWYRGHNIRLHAGVRATNVDLSARRVWGENVCESYDKLVFATGSRAFVPPMEGIKNGELRMENAEKNSPLRNSQFSIPNAPLFKPGVFVMRSLDDCRRIASFAAKCERACVLGGGLLGLEAARGLMRYGAGVTVVNRAGWLMNAQLDQTAGEMLQRVIEAMGISVLTARDTKGVVGDGHVEGVQFSNGEITPCEMLVIACGIAPNVELARDCGLNVRRAITVNDGMQTSDEAVYAVGECAEHRGQTYGLVAPLWEQAAVLADVLSGTSSVYVGSKTSAKLKVMGVEVASMGDIKAQDGDEEIEYREPKHNRYKKLIVRDNKLAGAILLGDLDRAASLSQYYERGLPLPDDRAALLFDLGDGVAASSSVANLPDTANVCSCNAVTKGALKVAIDGGCDTLQKLMSTTRAGTGCGSCKGALSQLLEQSV